MILVSEWSDDGKMADCLCEACRQSVGWVECDIVVKMINRGEHLFCMDCEGGADTVPDLLLPTEDYNVVIRDFTWGTYAKLVYDGTKETAMRCLHGVTA